MTSAPLPMPLQSFGTMESSGANSTSMEESVYTAIKAGYRHIDTAEVYLTSASVGKAVQRAINDKLVRREELFITSKIRGMPVGDYTEVENTVKLMLKALNLKYFDLLLIHWPGPRDVDLVNQTPEVVAKSCNFEWFKGNLQSAWNNMIRLQGSGMVKLIGTSNFYQGHIEELLAQFPNNRPFANQLYVDLIHQEEDFVSYLQENKINVIAYRSLVFLGVCSMVEEVNASLMKIQELSGATTLQQLALSWLHNRQVCSVSSSNNAAHIAANLKTVALSAAATDLLKALDGNEMVAMYGGVDEYAAAFKSLFKS